MSRSQEGILCKKIIDDVRAMGGFAVKLHGDEFSLAGLPDLFICIKGCAAWVEVKNDSPTSKAGNPSPLQYAIMRKIKRSGCDAFCARCLDDVLAYCMQYGHLWNYEMWYLTKEKAYLLAGLCKTAKKYAQFVAEKRSEDFEKKTFPAINISGGV